MRIWSFAGCEFDEEQKRLWIRGRAAKLGDRVLEVVHALLLAPEHACTSVRLSRIWGPSGSIDSVKDAVRQLRRACKQADIPEEVIRTVRGKGFQIVGRVTERTFELPDLWRSMRKGAPAPNLPGWELQVPLEPGARCRVWQIWQPATSQVRVVKYATDPTRRAALRRELRAWEAFERGLPHQQCFVRITSAHLTTWPCFVESEYGGLNLLAWSESQRLQGGLARETCLEVMADLAEAVGTAHSLGIIHNDLKPTNILLSPAPCVGGRWKVKVADFGVASVAQNHRLAEFQLSARTLEPGPEGVGGTSLYHAPEIGPGTTPTQEADVYALGVILFQLLCGDYQKTPYPGWEQQIGDAILQQDIDAACNIDPARRPNAFTLAAWLRSVESRRAELERQRAERERELEAIRTAEQATRAAEQRLAAELARRPVERALLLSLGVLALVAAVAAGLEIRSLRRARDTARDEVQQAETLERFLEQLFFDGDAAVHGPISGEQLAQRGLDKARVLESVPRIHAALLNTLGTGFEVLGNYPRAEQVLSRALDERTRSYGAASPQVADTLSEQAALADDEHRPQVAMQLAERALAIQQRALPRGDIAITRTQTRIAEILTDEGKYEQAAPLLEAAIAREIGHPDLLPDLSIAYNDLGVAENYRGHLERSIALQQQSMQIDRELQGDRHPDIAEHLLSIANAQDLLGQYQQAADETRVALGILEEALPPGHHDIAAAKAHLGTELSHLPASLPEARTYLEQATTALSHEPERSRTEAYADVALGSVAFQQNRDADALAAYKNSLRIYQQVYPKPDFAWAVPLNGMAAVYFRQHAWQDLQQTAQQAYQIASTTMSTDDPRRLTATILLAKLLVHQQQSAEAKNLLHEVVAHAQEPQDKPSRDAAQLELAKLSTP